MKFTIISFLLALQAFNLTFPFNNTFKLNEQESFSILVIVQHSNGLMTEIKLSEMQLLRDIPHFDDVTSCTVRFSDGSCERTANTCAEASAAFALCACAAGHERFCNVQQ
jgi:hypothetical protein